MESINNFRDFGGYKTQDGSMIKRGLLYRCARLSNASDNDLKKISSLGIKTIIDLRTNKERSEHPDRIPDDSDIKSIHIPIKAKMHNESGFIHQLLSLIFGKARKMNFDQVLQEVYREYVTGFRPEFSRILRLAADSAYLPLLIHCTGGKDRTGFASSLIQLMLGVPLKLVMHDYLLTNGTLGEMKDRFRKRLRVFSLFGVTIEKLLPLFEARTQYLEAALDQIRNDFGSVDDYARQGLNFSDEDKMKLKNLLLEK